MHGLQYFYFSSKEIQVYYRTSLFIGERFLGFSSVTEHYLACARSWIQFPVQWGGQKNIIENEKDKIAGNM
jgi:hypothetical protein